MPVMDEFKKEREEIKGKGFKARAEYFWSYNKWYVIIGLFVLFSLIYLIHDLATKKEYIFSAMFVNVNYTENVETLLKDNFEEQIDIDRSKQEMDLDYEARISTGDFQNRDVYAGQTFAINLMSGELDVVAIDEALFTTYAYQDYFTPLSELFTEEELAKYSDRLYYVDAPVVYEARAAEMALDDDYVLNAPDPFDPDSMKEPVAVAICIDDSELVSSAVESILPNERLVAGVIAGTKRPELSRSYILYLLGDPDAFAEN